jgi:hypothetical protein
VAEDPVAPAVAPAGPAARASLDKTLGSERIARRLRDALPGGDESLRGAVWTFLRRILSPRLTALNRDGFVPDAGIESTVDLAAHRADADLDELDLGDDSPEAHRRRRGAGPTAGNRAVRRPPGSLVRERPRSAPLARPRYMGAVGRLPRTRPTGSFYARRRACGLL